MAGVKILLEVLLFLHLLGMASLVAAYLVQAKDYGKFNMGWIHGVSLQLITGIAMVGVIDGAKLNNGSGLTPSGHAKIGVKLLVALVILIVAVVANNRPASIKKANATLGGLTLANVAIAVFWSA
jgi:hypothetical protein